MDSLTPEAYALLEAIADGESGGSYNTIYGGGRFKSFKDHPNKPVLITSGPNEGKYSTAAGKYQMLAGTWKEAKKALGLTDFSPASQDRAAWYTAQKKYGKGLQDDLAAGKLPTVAKKLSGTWTSLPHGIEAGRTLPQFTAKFNQSVERYKSLVPPADIPTTAVATQLDVARPASLPRQKPAAIQVAQASADPLQSAVARFAEAKGAPKAQAPNTTIRATVEQMNEAKKLLTDQLNRMAPKPAPAKQPGFSATTLEKAREEQAIMRARPAVQPVVAAAAKSPPLDPVAEARAEQALMRARRPVSQPQAPAAPLTRENMWFTSKPPTGPTITQPPRNIVERVLGTPSAPASVTLTPAPKVTAQPATPAPRPADVIRVTPEGLNVRGVESVKVDKYGTPIVAKPAAKPVTQQQPTEAQKRAIREVAPSAFVAPAPRSEPKPATGIVEFVQKFGSNTGTPAPLKPKPPKSNERLPADRSEQAFLETYYPDKLAAKRGQDIADALYPRPAAAKVAAAPVRMPMAKPAAIVLQQQRVAAPPPMPRPRPAIAPAPQRGGLLGPAPAEITVNGGGRQLVPQKQPSLLDSIVSALNGGGPATGQQLALMQQAAQTAQDPALAAALAAGNKSYVPTNGDPTGVLGYGALMPTVAMNGNPIRNR